MHLCREPNLYSPVLLRIFLCYLRKSHIHSNRKNEPTRHNFHRSVLHSASGESFPWQFVPTQRRTHSQHICLFQINHTPRPTWQHHESGCLHVFHSQRTSLGCSSPKSARSEKCLSSCLCGCLVLLTAENGKIKSDHCCQLLSIFIDTSWSFPIQSAILTNCRRDCGC